MILVCDIDGTISNCQHRQHLALAGRWDEFHALLAQDDPVIPVLDVFTQLAKVSDQKFFLTGRPEAYRAQTESWLAENCQLHLYDDYDGLLMRPNDDWRGDVALKPSLLAEALLCPEDELYGCSVLVLEDRDKVVARWRDLGVTCFQVSEGAF